MLARLMGTVRKKEPWVVLNAIMAIICLLNHTIKNNEIHNETDNETNNGTEMSTLSPANTYVYVETSNKTTGQTYSLSSSLCIMLAPTIAPINHHLKYGMVSN